MSTPEEKSNTLTPQSASEDLLEYSRTDTPPTPTINIESSPDQPPHTFLHPEQVKHEAPEAKRRCDSHQDHLYRDCQDHGDADSISRSCCDSMSDISQCSSTNRPISLCVKYNGSEDNLLAIESDMEVLDQESSYDKLQRQFDNSKLSDIFDYEQEVQRRRSMSAIPTHKAREYYMKGNETPTKSRVT